MVAQLLPSKGQGSVQLYWYGFESGPLHKVVGQQILAEPSGNKGTDWEMGMKQKNVNKANMELAKSNWEGLFQSYLQMLVSVGLLRQQDGLLNENFSFGELAPDDAGLAGLSEDVDDDSRRQTVVQKLKLSKPDVICKY